MGQYATVPDKLRLAIEVENQGKELAHEDKQRKKVWKRNKRTFGTNVCAICRQRVGRKSETDVEGIALGQCHHLIKRRLFWSPYEIKGDPHNSARARQKFRERKSRHHISNCVLLCRECHGRWENWANGRPHIFSWLFKELTGEEITLRIPSGIDLSEDQYSSWNRVQRLVESKRDSRCENCGKKQNQLAEQPVFDGNKLAFRYLGRDLRALHIVPPTKKPELTHHSENLVLLCWECIFGKSAQNYRSGTDPEGWKDRSVQDWTDRFGPPHYRI